jgi:endoglycosylceramidase
VLFTARRVTVSITVTVILLAVGVTSSTASSGSVPRPSLVGFVHVVVPRGANGAAATPYLADSFDRRVILRGVAVVGLQDVAYPGANAGPALFPVSPAAYDGKCPAATARIPQPPLCEVEASEPAYQQSTAPGSGDDFAEMRSLGFDMVRLVLNWSQLEPTPGHYSTVYVDRVAQVVGWAQQQGISVILDMHQDQYSRYILPGHSTTVAGLSCASSGGSDGAPKWAVFTSGKPACAIDGQSALNPAASAAFAAFWANHTVPGPAGQSPGTGLQDHYIGALATLARRFQNDPAVIGYELMNEPQPGSLASIPLPNLYTASTKDLYPFYQRAIEALTGVRDGLPTCPASTPTSLDNRCAYPALAHATRQLMVYEPLAYRNLVDFSPQVSVAFSSYPNLVYAPHVYTHTFTVDQFIGYPADSSPYPPSYTFGYQTAEAEAQAMHAAIVVTEYGAASSTDGSVLSAETAAQEDTLVSGSTLWAWKGLAKTAGSCWCVRWQRSSYATTADGTAGSGNPKAPVSRSDALITSRQQLMDRVWPRSVAGTLLAYRYSPTTRSFAMVAQSPGVEAGRAHDTVVYVPATVSGSVAVTGGAALVADVRAPDGSRLLYVAPTGLSSGSARYQVTVGAGGKSVAAAVTNLATTPLAPISEPQARAVALQALASAEASTNPQIKKNAALAGALSTLLLGSTDPNS